MSATDSPLVDAEVFEGALYATGEEAGAGVGAALEGLLPPMAAARARMSATLSPDVLVDEVLEAEETGATAGVEKRLGLVGDPL